MDLATIVKPKSAKHLKETEDIHGDHGLTKKHLTVILKTPPIKNLKVGLPRKRI